jgi:Glycosyl transferase family 2
MKLIGLMPVRNEDWVIGLTARVALMWCDELVILNHASDEGAVMLDILHESPARVQITDEHDEQWKEMEHRQKMLRIARANGATHIAIIDADELLTGNLLGSVRDLVEATPHGSILQLPGYNLRGSLDRYHANGVWGSRWFSTAFPDDPKLHWTGDTFHQREPLGLALRPYRPVQQGQGGVLHLWGVSERRLMAKHALYKITERLRWPDKPVAEIDRLYSLAFAAPVIGRRWEYAITPPEWLAPYAYLMDQLHIHGTPWQETESRRIVAEHPWITAGLDLFGVVG